MGGYHTKSLWVLEKSIKISRKHIFKIYIHNKDVLVFFLVLNGPLSFGAGAGGAARRYACFFLKSVVERKQRRNKLYNVIEICVSYVYVNLYTCFFITELYFYTYM